MKPGARDTQTMPCCGCGMRAGFGRCKGSRPACHSPVNKLNSCLTQQLHVEVIILSLGLTKHITKINFTSFYVYNVAAKTFQVACMSHITS